MAIDIQMKQKQSDGTYENLYPIITTNQINSIGDVVFSSTTTPPASNYVRCDGSKVDSGTYPELQDYLSADYYNTGITTNSGDVIRNVNYGNGYFVIITASYVYSFAETQNPAELVRSTVTTGISSSYTPMVSWYFNGYWYIGTSSSRIYRSETLSSFSSVFTGGASNSTSGYATNGTTMVVTAGPYITTSKTGASWTQVASPVGTVSGIAYGNGVFVITGASGAAYSSDGDVWTSISGVVPTGGVVFATDKFVSLTGYSTNGVSWVGSTAPSGVYRALISVDGRCVVTVSNSQSSATESMIYAPFTNDGVTWTNALLYEDFLGSAATGICAATGTYYTMVLINGGTYPGRIVCTDGYVLPSVGYWNGTSASSVMGVNAYIKTSNDY